MKAGDKELTLKTFYWPDYFVHCMHDSKVKDRSKAGKAIKSKMGPETIKQDWRKCDPFLDMMQSAASSRETQVENENSVKWGRDGNKNKAVFHTSHGPTRKCRNLWLVWLSVSPSLWVFCRKHSLCAQEVMKSLMLYGTWGIWGIAKQDVSWRKYSLSEQKVQVRYISQWCKSSIMHLA